MAKRIIECAVCGTSSKLKETEPDYELCPCCGTDMKNPGSETRKLWTNCDYVQGTFKSVPGVLILTDQRLFWVKSRITVTGTNLVGVIAATATVNKGAEKTGLSVPLAEIANIREAKKGLVGKTLIVHTTGGMDYQLMPSKLNTWKQALTSYMQ